MKMCKKDVLFQGMSDESFLRVVEGEKTVPMTKEEVRALSLCKLGLTEDAVVYDVGSGTGSIAVECAKCSPGIRVYAIEQKATAQQLLRRNLEKFHLANVIPVDGKAPEILESTGTSDTCIYWGKQWTPCGYSACHLGEESTDTCGCQCHKS